MDENLVQLITEIKTVASSILKKDVSVIKGFSERQVEAIGKQTLIIKNGILNGDIDEDLMDFFFDGLKAMALNFVNTLKGILLVTIEKVWNAIVATLWKVIGSVI